MESVSTVTGWKNPSASVSGIDKPSLRAVTGTGRSDEDRPTRFDVETYGRAIPLGRIAVPEDIVGPILFLMGEAARYVTGQVLHVNGGWMMRCAAFWAGSRARSCRLTFT